MRAPARVAIAGAFLLVAALAALVASPPAAGPTSSGPEVVEVRVPSSAGGTAALATGFEHRPGRVVTVAHVVPGRGARVLVRDTAGETRRAVAIAIDRESDLALLALRRPSGASPLPGAGEPRVLVRRAGRQAGMRVRVRRHIDARIRPWPGASPVVRPALELEARVRSGDSGAPVIGGDGRLLGVVFAQSRSREDTGYAVTADRVRALYPRRRDDAPDN